jgi:hypothetical protein
MNSSIPLSERLTFWLLWVVGTAVAGGVGWTSVVGLAYFSMGVGLIAFGLTVGGLVGAAQGGVLVWYLRRYINSDDWPVILIGWLIATILGIYACVAVVFTLVMLGITEPNTGISPSPYTAILDAIGGTAYGFFEWILLRQFVKNAWWWVPITAVGWSLGTVISRIIATRIVQDINPGYEFGSSIIMGTNDYLLLFMQGTIGAAIFGLVSATALALLVRPPALHLQEQLSTPSQPQRIADPS